MTTQDGLDATVALEIAGTRQRVRLRGARRGLPPVLIVQAGPGLPVINEVPKFQQRLNLEQDFSVAYWDQRGCGPAASRDTHNVSLETQVDDVSAVVRWLAEQTGQRIVVLGISLGATIAVRAAARDAGRIKAVVAVSIDTDTAASDAAAASFLQEAGKRSGNEAMARRVDRLGPPPYTTPGPLQSRARLLADLGAIEHGRRFGELFRGLLYGLMRAYGVIGTIATFRNMNAVQRRLLPEVANLNLFADWPRPAVPIHYIFGGKDLLMTPSMVQRVSDVVASKDTIVSLPDAGHMAHFDEPAVVRSLIVQSHSAP